MKRGSAVLGLVCLGVFVVQPDVVHGQCTGSIVGWGSQVVVEQSALEGLVAVAGGLYHSLGLKSDGTIVAWGDNPAGLCDVPAPNEGFIAIAGGYYHSLGLKSSSPTAVEEPRPGHASGAASLMILSLVPNPFNPWLEVSLETHISGPVTMSVYDVGGRLVRTMHLGELGPGLHRAGWDGRGSNGDNVASGVYFLRLRATEGESRAVKALLVR
jgi:hypothetical protein